MTWFTIIKGGLNPKEGKHGKHMTKMFMFLHRFFGKPAWGVETVIDFSKDTRDLPGFDKYYLSFGQLSSRIGRHNLQWFLDEIKRMEDCYDWDEIDWEGDEWISHKGKMPNERIPGLMFEWQRRDKNTQQSTENTYVTVTFDKERHIKVRNNMYRDLESLQQLEGGKTHRAHDDNQPFQHRPYSKRELEISESYWKRKKIRTGEYGKFEACLERKYKSMEHYVKKSSFTHGYYE